MFRRLVLICTLGAMVDGVIIWMNPVNSTGLKLGMLACLGIAWLGLLILLWKRRPVRCLLFFLPLTLILPLALPGREIDPAELREIYVRRMSGYEGTAYFWGGESDRGIDCSGLPRRALRDALLSYGLSHASGRAFRAWLEQWWFDTSALALSEGYRGFTRPLGIEGTIRGLDPAQLAPGDLAVTRNGIHVLAYAGNGQWIQADPGLGRVATLDGRKDKNGWFTTQVTLHRWKLLDGPADPSVK